MRCLIVRGQPFWVFGHVALHPVLIHCGLSPRNTPARMGGLLFLPKSRAASRLESRFYRWRWEGGNTPATHPMGGTRGRASTRTATRQCTAARQTVIYVHRQLPTRGGSLHIAARSVMCTNTAPTQHRALAADAQLVADSKGPAEASSTKGPTSWKQCQPAHNGQHVHSFCGSPQLSRGSLLGCLLCTISSQPSSWCQGASSCGSL